MKMLGRQSLKKLGVLAGMFAAINIMWFLMGGWTHVPVEEAVIAAPVGNLYQLGCPADAGVPAWLCTQLVQQNNINSALKASANSVNAVQAPFAFPLSGGQITGATKLNNAGLVIGTNTNGVTGETSKIKIQTADAGIASVGVTGNDLVFRTNLSGAQTMRFQNSTTGGVDAGNYAHAFFEGTVSAQVPSTGYYFQTVNVGNDSGYGDATTFSVESPHATFHPQSMYFIANGAFSGTEVVTVRMVGYDENDAGITMTPLAGSVLTTFDGGNTAGEYPDWNMWYVIASTAATKADTFQRKNFQRIVIDAKSDAGVTLTTLDVMVRAIQN